MEANTAHTYICKSTASVQVLYIRGTRSERGVERNSWALQFMGRPRKWPHGKMHGNIWSCVPVKLGTQCSYLLLSHTAHQCPYECRAPGGVGHGGWGGGHLSSAEDESHAVLSSFSIALERNFSTAPRMNYNYLKWIYHGYPHLSF